MTSREQIIKNNLNILNSGVSLIKEEKGRFLGRRIGVGRNTGRYIREMGHGSRYRSVGPRTRNILGNDVFLDFDGTLDDFLRHPPSGTPEYQRIRQALERVRELGNHPLYIRPDGVIIVKIGDKYYIVHDNGIDINNPLNITDKDWRPGDDLTTINTIDGKPSLLMVVPFIAPTAIDLFYQDQSGNPLTPGGWENLGNQDNVIA